MYSAVSQRRPALNRVDLLCQRGGPPYTEEVSVSQGKPSVSQRRPSVSQDALNRGGNINRLGPHWFESPVLFSICFILFYKCEFGPISKNSGLNPGSFRFLAGVRFGPVDTGRPLRPNCPSRNRSLDPPLHRSYCDASSVAVLHCTVCSCPRGSAACALRSWRLRVCVQWLCVFVCLCVYLHGPFPL